MNSKQHICNRVGSNSISGLITRKICEQNVLTPIYITSVIVMLSAISRQYLRGSQCCGILL